MYSLAFNTINNALGVALFKDGQVISEKNSFGHSKQAEFLLNEIESILKNNNIWYQNLEFITTINGPGNFTGVRIGLGVGRTIKLAINKPLILVNSCETLASKYWNSTKKICVILDARMDEIFYAKYHQEKELIAPQIIKLQELKNIINKNEIICGSGKKFLEEDYNDKDLINANLIGKLGYKKYLNNNFIQNSDPLYLRKPKIGNYNS